MVTRVSHRGVVEEGCGSPGYGTRKRTPKMKRSILTIPRQRMTSPVSPPSPTCRTRTRSVSSSSFQFQPSSGSASSFSTAASSFSTAAAASRTGGYPSFGAPVVAVATVATPVAGLALPWTRRHKRGCPAAAPRPRTVARRRVAGAEVG